MCHRDGQKFHKNFWKQLARNLDQIAALPLQLCCNICISLCGISFVHANCFPKLCTLACHHQVGMAHGLKQKCSMLQLVSASHVACQECKKTASVPMQPCFCLHTRVWYSATDHITCEIRTLLQAGHTGQAFCCTTAPDCCWARPSQPTPGPSPLQARGVNLRAHPPWHRHT